MRAVPSRKRKLRRTRAPIVPERRRDRGAIRPLFTHVVAEDEPDAPEQLEQWKAAMLERADVRQVRRFHRMVSAGGARVHVVIAVAYGARLNWQDGGKAAW